MPAPALPLPDRATTPIDPFGYWPRLRSSISGLGGSEAPSIEGYAFHTIYVAPATGRITFAIEADGLRASRGSIRFFVVRRAADNEEAQFVRDSVVDLAAWAERGGRHAISVQARPGFDYAVYGIILSETDAQAQAMRLYLDRWDDGRRLSRALTRERRSVEGRSGILARLWPPRPSAAESGGLIVSTPARFTTPLSQMCTAGQMDEPDYDRWLTRLSQPRTHHRKQWEFLYILQVLETQGKLVPGMRGLGFGVGGEYLPAFLAAQGCTVVATDLPTESDKATSWRSGGQHTSELAALYFPHLCATDLFAEHVSFRPVDMTAIPDDLTGFDFCWSACAYEHLGSIDAGLRFFEESMRCLKPGGVAVHTTELNLSSNDATVDYAETVLFRRRDMERLALELVAAGHDVTPITYDMGDRPIDDHIDLPPYTPDTHLKVALQRYVTTSFGLIARKHGG
jgi:SAM-dependent methyltransferase